MALLTKLPNFTSPGPEFLHCKFGASGVPLKGVRLMRSLKRHRQYHSLHLKSSNSVLSSLITSLQRKRTRRMYSQTSPPTHSLCFNVYVFINTLSKCIIGQLKDVLIHARPKHKNNTKRKPTEKQTRRKRAIAHKKTHKK